jgi:predicted ATPase
MITSLHIKNFKSHEDTNLELSNVNILTGFNGMGKSSAIQSLLLLRQSNLKNLLLKGLDLNGDLCSIGTAKDAIFISAETDEIEFGLRQSNMDDFEFVYEVNRNRIIDTFLRRTSVSNLPIPDSSIFSNYFQYISAFRSGPLAFYEKDTALVEISNQMSRKEGRCELIAHYFHQFKEDQVSDKSLTKVKGDDPKLKYQVIEWLQEISPNINNIYIDEVSGDSFKVEYSFSRGTGEAQTDKFKAMNVGFGVSYVLPIVVAALHMPKNGLVLIENPESHIHPAGQAKLMELICKAAKAGVQFIIETHSDHIINGLLVAVKKEIIDPNESKVYYFDRKISTHATQVTHLPVLHGGKIQRPPKGFFDQIAKDMTTLMGLKEWR